MDYLSIFDRRTGERLAILENAHDIAYTLTLNGLHTASFTLPADDPKRDYCQPLQYVEVWDGGKRVELFRILPSELRRTSSTKTIAYTCEHVLATLIDDVLYRYHEIGGNTVTTAQSIRYVLAQQQAQRWALDRCAFHYQYAYAVENENLLAALHSIAAPIPDDWMWTTDTTGAVWQLSLTARPTEQAGELRYGKNVQGITKTSDPTNLATRLYMLGYGEGDNQLGLESVTGGKGYIQSETANIYGVVSRLAVDKSIQDPAILLATAKTILAACDRPYIAYTVDAAAVGGDELSVGDLVRVIDDEEGISERMPIVSKTVSGVNGARTVTYEIANRAQDVSKTIADIADRQRIADLYSQGSTNIDSLLFADNASESKPAELKFYVSDKVMRLNALYLTFSLSAFRAYSTSASAGGGSSTTSSGGGGSSSSTSQSVSASTSTTSGGGTSVSGGTTRTSGATLPSNNTLLGSTYAASGSGSHTHYIYTSSIRDHNHSVDTSHSHSIGAHSHSVSIPGHSHSFSVPSHTHTVNIPAHTHSIEYGIYTGARASAATVTVDGVSIGSYSGGELDIIQYLSKDDGGRIRRNTWHTVRIAPNGLSRVEAALQQVCFINPRGGKDL